VSLNRAAASSARLSASAGSEMRAICQRRATGGVQARQRVTDHSQAAEREALLEPTRSRRRRYDRRPNARPYSTTGHISTLIVLLTFRAVSAAGPVPRSSGRPAATQRTAWQEKQLRFGLDRLAQRCHTDRRDRPGAASSGDAPCCRCAVCVRPRQPGTRAPAPGQRSGCGRLVGSPTSGILGGGSSHRRGPGRTR
jgi:hypothetical protein